MKSLDLPARNRAVALLSGGLDSTLAVKLMQEQGIQIYAITFITPFCTCTKKGCVNQAGKVARKFGIDLQIKELREEYIAIVRNPRFGYGRNMNPCLDCRIFMFSTAGSYMREVGASFMFTGEVLGQRPMSQRLQAMQLIERESGCEGRIVRPLSARHLEPTIPELEGAVDRSRLLAISGRSRKPQIAQAAAMGLVDYPCPAGGCRLTEPNFARRLREAFEYGEHSYSDVRLLLLGRHFRLPSGAKVIVGRNEQENAVLSAMKTEGDSVLEVQGVPGPITLLRRAQDGPDIAMAARICVSYSDCVGPGTVQLASPLRTITARGLSKPSLQKLMIG